MAIELVGGASSRPGGAVPTFEQLMMLKGRYLASFPPVAAEEARADVIRLVCALEPLLKLLTEARKINDRLNEEYGMALMTITALTRRAPDGIIEVAHDDVQPEEGARIEFNDITLPDGRLVKRFQYFSPGDPNAPKENDPAR